MKRAKELLYSVPFKCKPDASNIIDVGFYEYLCDYVADGFNEEDYQLYKEVFYSDTRLPCGGVEKVTKWINLLWPHWLEYCRRKKRDPGVYPVANTQDATPIEEIVF